MSKPVFSLVALLLAVAAVLFFPRAGWWFANALRLSPGPAPIPASELALEVNALKAELAQLGEVKKYVPQLPRQGVAAFVYSRYPFNFKSELLVNVGGNYGLRTGFVAALSAALASSPSEAPPLVLLGKLSRVFPDTALVQTVFDPSFQLAVRVGEKGIDALLQGGNEPRLTLIPKNAEISEGDIVYAAAPGFPYGIAVGEVGGALTTTKQVFSEARLRVPYDISTVQVVTIVSDGS